MAVKDILKYKQRGDRTVHWVREGSKSKVPVNPWGTLTINPGQIFETSALQFGQLGVSSGTATATAIQAQQARAQQYQSLASTPMYFYGSNGLQSTLT